jgi:prepilin-type N-terminal cleavage/methylation domain-containing protein
MISTPPSSRRGLSAASGRGAFTLLEILLVLVLLGLVAAMSWPAFEGWFRSHRLRQGVEEVRAAWVKGRARALREGLIYRFACAIASNQYCLAPDGQAYGPGAAGAASAPQVSGLAASPGLRLEATLPKGVQFLGWQEGSAGPNGTRGGRGGSDTILFMPDGTAKILAADGSERAETLLLMGDGRGQVRALRLRGVTGSVLLVSKSEL